MKVLHDATFTAGLHCDKHFFFTITINMCVIQNSMTVYFCPIYHDTKH